MSLVLCSGGIDSATILWVLAPAGSLAMSVDYGQRAAEAERRAASLLASRTKMEHLHLAVPRIGAQLQSALTGDGRVQVPRETVVPGRNALLISIAVGVAASRGLKRVLIGCNATDASVYPDCRREFVSHLDATYRKAYGVAVQAPLLDLTKSEVVRMARQAGLPIEETTSCYLGHACGSCHACVVRREAMEVA